MGIFSRKKDNKNTEVKKSKEKSVKDDIKPAGKPVAEESKSMKDLYEGGGSASKEVKSGKTEKQARKFGQAHKVLIKPVVTEKAANLGSFNKYVFIVAPEANKIEIAKAIKEVYGIKPLNVNIIRNKGKVIRYGRTKGKRKDFKKAIVLLPAGKTINIYEGV